jgi:hypothetical protein
MATCEDQGCGCDGGQGLERVRYFPRQLLTAEDMRTEQDYARQRQRRFNRFVMGWGVACGLEVKADPRNARTLKVCPGYALGPWGDEIYVAETVTVDLARRAADPADPCQPAGSPLATAADKKLYVVIRYVDCPSRPVRTSPADCGCDETGCEYSRIRAGFEIGLLKALPKSHEDPQSALSPVRRHATTHELEPCPPCPKDAWLVLATISVPSEGAALEIDCLTDRRFLA